MSDPSGKHMNLRKRWAKWISAFCLVFIFLGMLSPALPALANEHDTERAATAPPAGIACNNPTGAMDQAKCFVFQVLVEIFQIVVWFLALLVTLVVNVLIAFAGYNGFADATIVETGWRIVRDLVNMFFIVVLLVSAFATIIGYDSSSFNYKNVLPKLLLMAVLINFSKTLIQLLIDFSQVIMLTFVNAFQTAAAGNFVNAFRLNELTSLAQGSPGDINLVQILVSYMMAVFMISIMLGIVIILTAFLIFRIVGLWIALIFSPVAFFATALPGRLKKGFDSFTDKYWQRLSSLLVGGPIIAFFLWLTLSTVQGSADAGGLASGLNFATDSVPQGLTEFFTSSQIASFIVATTLMLMGLEAAVSSAQAISSTLGAAAGRIRQGAIGLGKAAVTSPLLAGAAVGYGAYRGGRAAARAVDRRFDVTGGLSRGALQAISQSRREGGFRGAVAGIAARVARPALVRGATFRRREAEAEARPEAAQLEELRKYAGPEMAQAVASTYSASTSKMRTLGSKRASEMISSLAASDDIRDEVAKKNKGAYVDQLKKQGLDDDDARASSEILAKQDALTKQRGYLQQQYQLAQEREDEAEKNRLEKLMAQNPELASDQDRDKYIEKLSYLDPDTVKNTDKYNAYNGEVLTGLMLKNGWQTNAQTGAMELADDAAWDRAKRSVKQNNKTLHEGMEAHEQLVLASPSQNADVFKAVQHHKSPKDGSIQAFTVKSSQVVTGKNAQGTPITATAARGSRFRNDAQRDAYTALKTAGESRKAGQSVDVMQMKKYVDSGGSMSDLPGLIKKDIDRVPLDDFAKQVVGSDAADAADAIARGDSSEFNQKMATIGRVFSSLDQSDIDAEFQTQILSSFAQNRGKDIVSNYNKLAKDLRPKVLKALEVAIDRVNNIKLNKSPAQQNAQEKALITMVDELAKEAEKTGQQRTLPSAVSTMLKKA